MKKQFLSTLLRKNGMVSNHPLLKNFMIPGVLYKDNRIKYKMGVGALKKTSNLTLLGEILPDAYISHYTGSRRKIIKKTENNKKKKHKTRKQKITRKKTRKIKDKKKSLIPKKKTRKNKISNKKIKIKLK